MSLGLKPPPLLSTPEQASLAFVEALNEGDLDAAALCFARDACLLTPDATAIRGREEIRSILAQLIARSIQIHVQASNMLMVGEVALGSERWVMRFEGVGGSAFEQDCNPTVVLRRIEGAWKLVIATPWG